MSETCAGCFDDPALGHLFDCPTRIHGLEAERDAYKAALAELLEEAEDMRSYVPEYFAKKWHHDEALDRARSVLAGVVSTREKDK